MASTRSLPPLFALKTKKTAILIFLCSVVPLHPAHAASEEKPPFKVALDEIGHPFQAPPSRLTIEQKMYGKSVENPDLSMVIITKTTPMDDSVAAISYKFILKAEHGAWKTDRKFVTYKCQKGRGHLFFSSKLCS